MKMRFLNILSAAAGLTAMSCMALPFDMESIDERDIYAIEGTVSDSNSNPIEYIMVTLDWGTGLEPDVLYTSSEGKFKTNIPEPFIGVESSVTLTLTDIDGEKNGGEFETLTDKVMLFQEADSNDSTSVVLNYRLNHATPSESIPQS